MADIYHISQNRLCSPKLWEARCVDEEAGMWLTAVPKGVLE